jgi:phosphohistidine swiveling domain-containing protein
VIVTQVCAAYATLGNSNVAVRSSATAEDLPGASFAGQHDTYLNVVGEADLLDAIRRCWASLWNERAVAYRRANGIDEASVRLAIVVQQMVQATAAGVLFTADPLTGKRQWAAIDAIPELGEKLVSGAVNPDHYVLDTKHGRIVERTVVHEQAVLSDDELLALATLGDRAEQHFGAPQDVEFAFDDHRQVRLVQTRPITTVYPLPAHVPDPDRVLRVYFSANVFQGYFEPLTPMGIQFFRLLGTAGWRAFGVRVADAASGPSLLVEAGMRLYVDVTPIVRDSFGGRAIETVMAFGEARGSVVLARLATDPRFAPVGRSRVRTIRRLVAGLFRVGIPQAAVGVVLRPSETRTRYVQDMEEICRVRLAADTNGFARLDAFERLLLSSMPALLPRLLGIMLPTMLSLVLARMLLRGKASEDELQAITRGAPHNPTTEMDLALWSLSVELRADPDSRRVLMEQTPADLVAAYASGALPEQLQAGLGTFLSRYGFRSIGEIDIGVPRWSEQPAHILGALANYLRLAEHARAPDAQFAGSAHQADATVRSLIARVHGPRRMAVRFVLRRVRELIGSRETPKFQIIRLLATPARELLKPVGVELAAKACIDAPDDIFFLTLPDARRALAGEDLRSVVRARRQEFEREHRRRHIPRVLLSDGTDAEAALVVPASDGLRGSPASPGVVSGAARVIHSPEGAHLEPGEILVAPSTDPGWTPLFLTAGGLVMEMGGMMSHGAVVAREYGIPAVVGVAGATDQITTGQCVTVDGSAGTVSVDPQS